MIVDSSALLAVLLREPDATRHETAIAVAPSCRMSAVNVLETSIVVESRGGEAAVSTTLQPPACRHAGPAQRLAF